jgi:peptidyl-prolyl cis-trans isomerase C
MRSFLSKSTILIIIIVSITLCSLSCNKKSPKQAETSNPQSEQANEAIAEQKIEDKDVSEPKDSEQPANEIVVTVNGVDITEQQLQKIIQSQMSRMTQANKQLPPSIAQALQKQLRPQAIEQLIAMQLLEQKAKETNVVITDDELNQQLTSIASAQNPPVTVEQLKTMVENQGFNYEQWKNDVRKQLVPFKLFKSQFPEGVTVTQEDAKKYYDENPGQFEIKEEVRASHILIKPETEEGKTEATSEAKAKAKAKAEDLLKQIKEGADFATLAKANSDCPSSAEGGDLKFFTKDRMVAPFANAAFAMEPGQVSDIVETSFGYHIIKVTDRKPGSTTPFEKAKDSIIQRITQRKQIAQINKYIASLKTEANIVYPPGKEPKPAAQPMTVPQPK